MDPNAYDPPLTDYFTVVRHPMDFTTISEKLNKHQYRSLQQFTDDVKLCFDNCILYNGEGSEPGIMARQLSEVFNVMIAPLLLSTGTDDVLNIDPDEFVKFARWKPPVVVVENEAQVIVERTAEDEHVDVETVETVPNPNLTMETEAVAVVITPVDTDNAAGTQPSQTEPKPSPRGKPRKPSPDSQQENHPQPEESKRTFEISASGPVEHVANVTYARRKRLKLLDSL